MFGGSGKRGFVRTRIPGTERLVGAAILVLLVAIGGAIYSKGERYDPALFALDTEKLPEGGEVREEVRLVERAEPDVRHLARVLDAPPRRVRLHGLR